MKLIDIYNRIYTRIEEFKIYILIMAFTAIFLGISIFSLNRVKDEFVSLAKNYRTTIVAELSNYVTEWMNSRISSVNSYSTILSSLILDDNITTDRMYDSIDILSKTNPMFDTFQLYIENDRLLIHASKYLVIDQKDLDRIAKYEWYKDTKDRDITTIRVMPNHKVLNEKTINICSPLKANGKFKGVLCGIIKTDNILKQIKGVDKNIVSHLFLMDKNHDIITSYYQPNPFVNELKNIDRNFTSKEFISQGIKVNVLKTSTQDWAVGVGINENAIIQKSLIVVAKTSMAIFGFFIILIIVANLLHNYLYTKINKRKQEYEFILTHQLKMIETGELVGVMSHQLKQPLNSAKLMISSILQLKQDEKISKDEELQSLALCLKSMEHLNQTVENFKNFYKFDPSVAKFSVKRSIDALINILHVDFAKNNVSVIVGEFEDIEVCNCQNLFTQVLLVLLQNSKEALIAHYPDEFKKRQIYIKVKSDENYIYIEVSDFAGGISDEQAPKLFSNLKISKKKGGSGIGLYFAKKIANTKLSGDLTLVSKKDPTVFELRIKK
ncbi:sensor histidine kinase [Campylobacter hyointestinalis]|uniref:sensor histidine kinase n=1 Tax=Campylobacter hyointestinalis TaxID=198 RepID=UPI000CE3C164|nr:sensor histidine kinase [Campylobacter hyointestinalis]PPB73774.1 histidine kinase [Campylobacter hyointestinalis subsp. hyointestinalis]PPB75375.1 histidine kinase [Campylobacter hyointestinalis subsp. hyointestinalis]PPB77035.1 histidine kinase [Campylobacter hyointestinalis subsp. hyointestinalis]PPB79128.1 histidine kinase [Campylobacter hyointestinalis subsp. hyointestinalis]